MHGGHKVGSFNGYFNPMHTCVLQNRRQEVFNRGALRLCRGA